MEWLKQHGGKALVGVAAVGLIGFFVWQRQRGAAVQAHTVERTDVVQTVLVSGRVLPPAEVVLTARIEAPVLEVNFGEGDSVEAGAVLAQLDATSAEAEAARARALLARAQATSGRTSRIAPQVAQQGLATAQIQLEEARRTLEQAQRLVASGAWPAERTESAEDAVNRARSRERSARLELSAARGVDRQAAAASVEEALAALALADAQLAHTTLRAPVAGVILARELEVGDTPRPGTAVFRLAADGPPILSVDPDERHLSQLELGQRADVASDAYPAQPFEAAVSFIAPAVDPERGTVEVRLLPTESIDFLRPNLTVSVEIEVARSEDTLVLPLNLVGGASAPEPWAWIEEGGRLARQPLVLGLRGDEHVEVREGLSEGDRVIDVSDPDLDQGARIRIDE